MKVKFSVLFAVLILIMQVMNAQENKKEITFKSADDVSVSGDLYLTAEKYAAFIILFHQAGYSRGEYIETAPKFNEMGFNCLAIDQRSGEEVNGIVNQTYIEAKKKGLKTKYPDAMPDLEAAIDYIIKNYNPKKLIILGSSYSASLSLILASKYPDKIDAVLAFSPGEYFKIDDKEIKDFAVNIKIPVFITSAKLEKLMWNKIFEAIPEEFGTSFLPEVKSIHGSRALWSKQKGAEACWNAVEEFLDKL
ncbi:MAG: alpha/beta fold hydrolase [Salinivirgaceae bacterium]|nr:alpha/beta fold hydrolase [Salinivirgaceae bacterium]